MARSFSLGVLAGVLVLGLVIGGVGAFFYRGSGSTTTSTVTTSLTSTTTVLQSASTTTMTVTSTSTSSSTGPDIAAALTATANASLAATEWDFAKGSLVAWIENTGNESIVLSPNMFLYNGTFVNSTHFVVIDPKVTEYGNYALIPPGSSVIVELIAPLAITGDNSTLSVLNYTFVYTYGTSKD
ncbi:MAG: hypothetical protein M1587_05830 [Thaumarchaeota archaeon]|nr:hypothetical protein [Nitrososphaerota archaeon]